MSSLLDMVQQQLGGNTVNQIAQQIGTDPAAAQSAVTAALPMLLGGMAHTASDPAGATAINAATESHSGMLGNLSGLLGAAGMAEGGGLLGRILGANHAPVQEGVSKATGLDPHAAGKLLLILAPIVVAVLARHKQSAAPDSGGLSTVLQQSQQAAQQQAEQQHPQMGGVLGSIMGQIFGSH